MKDAILTETFLQRLRNTTASSHEALESLPASKKIIDPAVTKSEYTTYLSLMYSVIHDTETLIFPVLENSIPDLHLRQKSAALAADLNFLGANLPLNHSPLKTTNYSANTAFALGVMYVIEGSTLGGRVIYKNIHSALGYTEASGAAYFAGYGGTTGSKWKSFIELLVNYAEEHGCEDEIISGANFAFNAIKNHLS
jgi:heme oxygenase